MEVVKTNDLQEKEYDYSTTYTLGKKEYEDIDKLSYLYLSVLLLILLGFLIYQFVFLCQGYPLKPESLKSPTRLLLLTVFSYVAIEIIGNVTFKRMAISWGQKTLFYEMNFGDKIYVKTEKHVEFTEYDYSLVKKLKRTKQFYLLVLQYNVSIAVPIDIVGKNGEEKFVEYIINKCPNLKRKRVINMGYYKKLCSILLVIYAVVLAASWIIYME